MVTENEAAGVIVFERDIGADTSETPRSIGPTEQRE